MFGVNEVRDIFGIEVSRSSDMQTALDLYKGMRSGLPTWCMDGTIKPTRFSNVISGRLQTLHCSMSMSRLMVTMRSRRNLMKC